MSEQGKTTVWDALHPLRQGLGVNMARSSASQDSLTWHSTETERSSQVSGQGQLHTWDPSAPGRSTAQGVSFSASKETLCVAGLGSRLPGIENSPSPLPQEFHGATGPINRTGLLRGLGELTGVTHVLQCLARSKFFVQLQYELLQ